MSGKQIIVQEDSQATQQETRQKAEVSTQCLKINISGEFDKQNLGDILQIQQELAQKLKNININIVAPTQTKIRLDKEFSRQLQENYRLAIAEHEEKYKAALRSKDDQIAIYKERTEKLKEIIENLSRTPIVIKQELDSDQGKTSINDDKRRKH